MCLLMQDNPERINVNDTIRIHLHNSASIDGVVKKMPSWFSKEWIILTKNELFYVKDYASIRLIKKARTNINL